MGICLKKSLSEFWTIFEKSSKLSKDTKEELEKYKNLIKKLADREIRNTPEKDLKDLSDILVVLAMAFNEANHKKTIVLIDKYDVPLEKS